MRSPPPARPFADQRFFVALLLAVAVLGGCSTTGFSDPRLENTSLDDYRLDSGDRVRISVFGQPDLSGEYSIDGAGMVAIPLLAPVRARGGTSQQFALYLESILAQTLLRDPKVSVEIAAYRPFFILGEVNRPGQYPFVNGMTVQTAAAIAGGFTPRAAMSSVKITRAIGPERLEGAAILDARVMPGDTIMVAERFF